MGYLKKHHNNLFLPKLPLAKIKAIENIGFGCVDKIFIVYEKNVFKNAAQGLLILWRDDFPFKLDMANQKWNLQV